MKEDNGRERGRLGEENECLVQDLKLKTNRAKTSPGLGRRGGLKGRGWERGAGRNGEKVLLR